MSKLKIYFISFIIVLIFVLSVFFVRYIKLVSKVNKLNKKFEDCKGKFYIYNDYYGASLCFSDIAKESGKLEYRYYNALALFRLQQFDKSKDELKIVIKNSDNIQNKALIEKSEKMYNFLNNNSKKDILVYLNLQKRELSEENSNRLDIGDYYSDLKKTATWQNPKNISVYINAGKKQELIKSAFEIWDKSLGGFINFSFVKKPQNANIVCNVVTKLPNAQLGDTKTRFENKNGKRYIKSATIQIAILDPFEGEVISDEGILSTTLHEIGHSIGIISHSLQKGDVMYFDSTGYKYNKAQISKRDINTVKKIYGNI